MQILIIKLPVGEQISSLSYNIDSAEVIIGRDAGCQIQLPDQRQRVAQRHGRFYQEGEQWFLECLGENELTVNQTTISTQRVLLSDGDLITCGDYQLAISQFEPWQNPHKLSIRPPPLPSAENLAPEYCVIPDKEVIQTSGEINDPFDHPAMDIEEVSPNPEGFTDLTMDTPNQAAPLTSGNQLIDVLAPTPEMDNDWSIHRALWSGESIDSEDMPEPPDSCSIPVLSERIPESGQHKKSICNAMLDALEQTLEDLSPKNLDARFSDLSSNRISRYFGNKSGKKNIPSEASDFRLQYQHFHQKLMDDESYRLLFLQ